MMLQAVAPPTYPTFGKFSARKVYLNDNPLQQSLKVHVYLNYQGVTRLAHTHTFAYDEEERNHFLFNSPDTKQGLTFACQMITTEFTKLLSAQ